MDTLARKKDPSAPVKRDHIGNRIDFSPCSGCNIHEMALCQALSCHELKGLSAIVANIEVAKGATLINETDQAEFLFNVTQGSVKLYKLMPDGRRQITGFLFPGDFLGIALNDRYAYSAEALEATKACRFPRKEMEGLLREMPELEHRLLSMVSNELVLAQEQMLLLGRKTAQEKLCSFLKGLYDRRVKRFPGTSSVPLPMSRSDMGDFLGLTTETVSRTMTNLKKKGVVALPSKGIVNVVNYELLSDLAEGV